MDQKLYFIAVIPPGSLVDSIQAVRKNIAERFRSFHALRSPPHITLRMPFQFDESRERKLKAFLQTFAAAHSAFEVTLRGYGRFFEKVIFIKVIANESLKALHAGLSNDLRQLGIPKPSGERPFNPHITIAHRDLKPAEFKKAWQEFENKKFDARYEADSISLLRHHAGGWEVIGTFSFEKR